MAITTVSDWLRTRGNFALGVDLLKLHGTPSPAQLLLFAQGEDGFSRQVLETALRAVNEQSAAALPERKAVHPTHAQAPAVSPTEVRAFVRALDPDAGTDIKEHLLPAALRPLRTLLRDKHRSLVFLRGQLTRTPDGIELARIAGEIVRLRRELNAGWMEIEHWRATGRAFPRAEETGTLDRDALKRRLNTVRVRLSEAKSGKRPLDEGKQDALRKERDGLVNALKQ